MSVIRVNKQEEKPWVTVDKTCSKDTRLSWKAKGLHTYLMGKPDNWEAMISHLVKKSEEGKHAVTTGLQELEDYGYLHREPVRNDKGQIEYWRRDIYERPDLNPHFDGPLPENQEEGGTPETTGSSPHPDYPDEGHPDKDNQSPISIDLISIDINIDEEDARAINKKCVETFDSKMRKVHWKKLKPYLDKFSLQVLLKAFEVAQINFASSFNYIIEILQDWHQAGLHTVEDIELYLQDRNSGSGKSGGNNSNPELEKEELSAAEGIEYLRNEFGK